MLKGEAREDRLLMSDSVIHSNSFICQSLDETLQ